MGTRDLIKIQCCFLVPEPHWGEKKNSGQYCHVVEKRRRAPLRFPSKRRPRCAVKCTDCLALCSFPHQKTLPLGLTHTFRLRSLVEAGRHSSDPSTCGVDRLYSMTPSEVSDQSPDAIKGPLKTPPPATWSQWTHGTIIFLRAACLAQGGSAV